jgi:hypothetical protein
MTTPTPTDLRAVAEAARDHFTAWALDGSWLTDAIGRTIAKFRPGTEKAQAFISQFDPPTVLGLLDERDRLDRGWHEANQRALVAETEADQWKADAAGEFIKRQAAEERVRELEGAAQSLLGAFDTPISRRRSPPTDFQQQAIDEARALLSSTPVAGVASGGVSGGEGEAAWQDISTAPRDGTWFRARCPTQVRRVRFDGNNDRFPIAMDGDMWDSEPTHWMPLPPAPTRSGEAG